MALFRLWVDFGVTYTLDSALGQLWLGFGSALTWLYRDASLALALALVLALVWLWKTFGSALPSASLSLGFGFRYGLALDSAFSLVLGGLDPGLVSALLWIGIGRTLAPLCPSFGSRFGFVSALACLWPGSAWLSVVALASASPAVLAFYRA